MPLDFFVISKDTGTNYAEAIQPVKNGEDGNQDVFERPSENLRTRTEDIRKLFDLVEAVAASDRGLTIMAKADAHVDWDATAGTFVVNDNGGIPASRDLYVVPLLSTTQGPAGTPPGAHIPSKYVYYDVGNGSKFSVEAAADLRDHGDTGASRRSGANNLFFEFKTDGGTPVGTPSVAITGDEGAGTFPADGPITITVTVNTAGDTAALIIAALVAADPTDEYINTSSIVNLVPGTCVEAKARARFYDGATGDPIAGTQSMGAVDPEGILVSAIALASFFGDSDNALDTEGDVLVVDFTGAEDRLNNQTDTSMTGMLQKLSRDTVQAAKRHVVPICKVFDGDLYFLNGTMFQDGEPGRLIPDPGDITALAAEYAAHVAGTADQHADSDITANSQDPAAASGQTLPISLPNTSDVRAHIGDLLTYLDNHMDGEEANFKHPDSDVTADLKGSGDTHELAASEVNTQLTSLLGFVNDHIDAAAPADKHPDSDITAAIKGSGETYELAAGSVNSQVDTLRDYCEDHIDAASSSDKHKITDIKSYPSYVVDPSGDGDYGSLLDALTAAGTGGGVYSLIGAWVGTLEVTCAVAFSKPTRFTTHGYFEQTTDSAAPILQFTNSVNAPLTFENFKFTCAHDTELIVQAASTEEAGTLRFINCTFARTVASTKALIDSQGNIEFINCHFEGNGYNAANAGPTFLFKSTSDTLPRRYIVRNCTFNNWRSLVTVGVTTTFDNNLGKLVFSDNQIRNCGYCGTTGGGDGDTAIALLDHIGSVNQLATVIENNVWDDIGAAAANSGRFVDLYAPGGALKNNKLYRPPTAPDKSTGGILNDAHIIAFTGGFDNPAYVEDNYMVANDLGGVATQYAIVCGNSINEFKPRLTNTYGLLAVDKTTLRDNNITYAASENITTPTAIYCSTTGEFDSVISGNRINNARGTGGIGIHIEDAQFVKVVENHIEDTVGMSTAIKVEDSSDIEVIANTVLVTSTSAVYGIHLLTSSSNVERVTVSKNVILGNSAGTMTYGIYLSDTASYSLFDVGVYENVIQHATDSIMVNSASTAAKYLNISNNRIKTTDANTTRRGIWCRGIEASAIVGNTVVITGSLGTSQGINLSDAAKGNAVTGNTISAPSPAVGTGIVLGSGVTINCIAGNTILDCTTASIQGFSADNNGTTKEDDTTYTMTNNRYNTAVSLS